MIQKILRYAEHLGLDKEQIRKVKSLKSRWVTILKTYPKCILSEKDVLLINTL